MINLNEGVFYCFGCNASGNAIDFVKLANHDLDDLSVFFKYFSILKSKKTRSVGKRKFAIKNEKESIEEKEHLLDVAHDYYFGLKTVDWFDIQDEAEYMKNRGFLPKTLNNCKAKLTMNRNYPIVFPMFDLGEFKGWVCRTTDPKIEKKRKYLYNKGFSRRSTLVGDYKSKTVVLVEGYMDHLKFKQAGVKNVAAILGWKITEQQINKLKANGVKTIISALDKDTCGNKGTEVLKKHFEVLRFQFPDSVKDPGDMNKKQFKIAIEKTKNLRRNKRWD